MHRVAKDIRPSGLTVASGIVMAGGSLLYLQDQIASPRNWHAFLVPALILMGIGALLAIAGAIHGRR